MYMQLFNHGGQNLAWHGSMIIPKKIDLYRIGRSMDDEGIEADADS